AATKPASHASQFLELLGKKATHKLPRNGNKTMSINHIKLARLDSFPYTPAATTTILFRLNIKRLDTFIANRSNDSDIGCPINATSKEEVGQNRQKPAFYFSVNLDAAQSKKLVF